MSQAVNSCDGCTLCCRLLAVPWMNSPAGDLCRECVAGEGCRLWPDPPTKCRVFNCAYLQSPGASTDLRPDNCGVIFEKIEDVFFLGTVAADFEMTRAVEGQIQAFLSQGFSVVLNTRPRKSVWLREGHTQEMLQRVWREALDGNVRD